MNISTTLGKFYFKQGPFNNAEGQKCLTKFLTKLVQYQPSFALYDCHMPMLHLPQQGLHLLYRKKLLTFIYGNDKRKKKKNQHMVLSENSAYVVLT
jgi:hypothetical protein